MRAHARSVLFASLIVALLAAAPLLSQTSGTGTPLDKAAEKWFEQTL